MIDKIKGFAQLEIGWDSYHADPPNSTAIDLGIQLYELFTVKPRRVTPSVVGGIGMAWHDIYLEIDNEGEVYSVFRYDVGEPIISKEVSWIELDTKIKNHVPLTA